jgi:serine/threonine protein kinase
MSEASLRVPGYDLLEAIGEGGMGVVYRAHQRSLQRPVAIKFIHPSPDGQRAPSVHLESRLMAALSHPHVVAIHDCGQADGHAFLVMEYVDGSSLRARLKPGQPWPVEQALPLLAAVASALAYIHAQGILHLDLKPENVLLGRDGQIKVTDFGLARPQPDAAGSPAEVPRGGTLDYSPPEQRFGLAVDQRADLFSLATLAYELLSGRQPGRVYVPCSRWNPPLPAAVDEVLRRGLARHPEERYPTVDAFWTDLHSALAAGQHLSQRRMALAALVTLLVVLLVLLGLSLVGLRSRAEAARRSASSSLGVEPPPTFARECSA